MVHAEAGNIALQGVAACVDSNDFTYQYTTIMVKPWTDAEFPMRVAVPVPHYPGKPSSVLRADDPLNRQMGLLIASDMQAARAQMFAAARLPSLDLREIPVKKMYEDTERGKYEWLSVEIATENECVTVRHALPFSTGSSLPDQVNKIPLYYPVELDLPSLSKAQQEHQSSIVTVITRPHCREYLVLSSTVESNHDLFLPPSLSLSLDDLFVSFGHARFVHGLDGAAYYDLTSNHAVRFEFMHDACAPTLAGMPLSTGGKQLLLRGRYGIVYAFRDWMRGSVLLQELGMERGLEAPAVRRQWVVDCERWMPLRACPTIQCLLVNELPCPP